MTRSFSLFLIIVACFFQLNAQQKLSTKASISVVTCGPGTDLYTAFGHSAFRVFDPSLGIDKVYNYGTFDFNAPNFYLNFAKGNLTYFLATGNFNRFLRIYQYENRWVKTQVLNLSNEDVQAMYLFLEENAKPENRNYQYDFFYDNCSTKIEAVVTAVLKDKIQFSNKHITTQKTHRDLIYDYTKDFKWGKFGIDLALGAVIDDEASKNDYKFLPDYIFEAFEQATIQKEGVIEPLVQNEYLIIKEKPIANSTKLLTPFNVILLFSLLIVYKTYKNFQLKKRSKWLDFLLFLTTGIIGILVLLLWFATTHTATYQNFNFLWAFAPNIVIAFYLLKTNTPKWLHYYLILNILLLITMVICWLLKIQIFNLALLPLIVALALRYVYLMQVIKLKK
ncbi:DUF4105 domain-containing protein [Lutibacter holmesii]|uniref:DUF4105 domain-containing protein n=1 Tax=Lutibacter holmesii TaxID=1137985 RepID=A0ABW3WR38_9FLAO